MESSSKKKVKTGRQVKTLPKFTGQKTDSKPKFNPATFKTQHKG